MKIFVLIASLLQWLATLLLRLAGERKPVRFCGFCSSAVCTACCRAVDGPGARGEFCSTTCRDKPAEAHAPGWSEGSFTSGMADDGDSIIRMAMQAK